VTDFYEPTKVRKKELSATPISRFRHAQATDKTISRPFAAAH
jgi:hypothetical protein